MIRVHNPIGRLITIRLISPVEEGEYDRFDVRVRQLVQSLPPELVFCSDLRTAGILPDSVAARIPMSMRRDSPWLKRAALITSDSSAYAELQFRRILKEASSPKRRCFTDPQEALTWLGEILRPFEQRHLVEFLSEPG